MSSITVRVRDDMVQELDELARAMDRSRSWVVTDALARYLAEERHWMEQIRRGIEELDRGEGSPLDIDDVIVSGYQRQSAGTAED